MTEFKKGDHVVTVPGVTRSLVGTTFPERSTGVIDNVAPEDLGVVLDGGVGFVALGFAQVEHAPAPLDPSKVKAGDTVEAEVQGGDLTGNFTVSGVAYILEGHPSVGGWSLDQPRVTLTDHQPAPEPEFEHRALYAATVRGVPDTMVQYADPDDPMPWLSLEPTGPDKFRWHEPKHVTDVRPLVVIDPAAVDKHVLAGVYQEGFNSAAGQELHQKRAAGIDAVLAHIGIEAS